VLKSSRASCAIVLGALTLSRAAQAQTETAASPYEVNWALDLSVTIAAAAVWLLPQSFGREIVKPPCPCDRTAVRGFDSFALGRRSSAADTASNVAVTTFTVAPILLDALDVHLSGGSWSSYGIDLVVMLEALTINGALNETMKLTVRRPRPLVYDPVAGSDDLTQPDSYLSFYSGHTSSTAAVTMAYATTFALRHPDSPALLWIYGGAAVGTATMGLLRVLAGKHFPTDVLAGAAVGSAVGLVVPRLHARNRQVMAVPVAGGALLLVGGRM
jgi:membrane-associated phospholipid phosphatase